MACQRILVGCPANQSQKPEISVVADTNSALSGRV
jgi:hypothetical protein